METRRVGKFAVETWLINTCPAEIRAVMATCTVIRSECVPTPRDQIEYIAISDDFDAVPESAEPPWYSATVSKFSSGGIKVQWSKVALVDQPRIRVYRCASR